MCPKTNLDQRALTKDAEPDFACRESARGHTFHAQVSAFHGDSGHVRDAMNVAAVELQSGIL